MAAFPHDHMRHTYFFLGPRWKEKIHTRFTPPEYRYVQIVPLMAFPTTPLLNVVLLERPKNVILFVKCFTICL